MNEVDLYHNKKLTPFFFEKKLYQFSSKSLNKHDRKLMKEYSEINKEAKKNLASVFMSIEYLNQLEETKIDTEWVSQQVKKEQKKENAIRYIVIGFLVFSLFFMSYLAYKVI